MPKKHTPSPPELPEHDTTPAPPETEPHHDVSSPAFEHANDRMKLAAEPNDGEPLSHRDRAKAGRKG